MSRITFDHVTKVYAESPQPAVEDCDFTVDDGQLVVILGPSGCGKTTLLKTVNRLVDPTSGRVLLGDRDVTTMPPTELRRHIGYVIQDIGLFPHMTVEQNVGVVPRLLGWDRQRIRRRVEEMLELVSMPATRYAHRYPAQLSGGQQQRVGVARALAGDPEVILMDEPFGAIDAINRSRLQDELCALQNTLGKTILFVTHDVDEALRLAHKVVVMREGRVVQYATPQALLREPASGFVAELIGADDIVRQLGVLRVDSVMRRVQPTTPEGPKVSAGESLRQALSVLVGSDAQELRVVDGERTLGVISLDDLRLVADGRGHQPGQ